MLVPDSNDESLAGRNPTSSDYANIKSDNSKVTIKNGSNGETGRIIMMQRNQLDKPVVALDGNRFIDLRDEPNLSIVGIV